MKKIKINGRTLESVKSLEETLLHLNLQAGYEYGSLFAFVLKVDFQAKTYELTFPSDNEESLPIVWIGNYLTNDREEYTSLVVEKALDNAIEKLANEGLEAWGNSISYVLNPADYVVFSNKPAIKR